MLIVEGEWVVKVVMCMEVEVEVLLQICNFVGGVEGEVMFSVLLSYVEVCLMWFFVWVCVEYLGLRLCIIGEICYVLLEWCEVDIVICFLCLEKGEFIVCCIDSFVLCFYVSLEYLCDCERSIWDFIVYDEIMDLVLQQKRLKEQVGVVGYVICVSMFDMQVVFVCFGCGVVMLFDFIGVFDVGLILVELDVEFFYCEVWMMVYFDIKDVLLIWVVFDVLNDFSFI